MPLEVSRECGTLAEALSTHATSVGLSTRVAETRDHVDAGMVPQSSTAVEGPRALRAMVERAGGRGGGSGGLWRVRPCQVERKSALPKGAGAQRAAVGLLRWVLAKPMQQQCGDVREATATEAARVVAAAPSVYAQVQVQQGALTEALATLSADVEGLASMGPLVCPKVCDSSTAFTTLKTAETLVTTMGTLVPQQHCTVPEALATLTAGIRSFPNCSHVRRCQHDVAFPNQ